MLWVRCNRCQGRRFRCSLLQPSVLGNTRSTEAQRLDDAGLFPILGKPGEEYWRVLRGNYGYAEQRPECLGLMLYGDEADALGASFMTLNWSSEHSTCPANPSMSRFLITLFEKERYAMSANGNNLTLQAVLREIVFSLNVWGAQKIGGFFAAVAYIKGDWKFLRQALNLKRHYNANRVCFKCLASKDLSFPYTDVSSAAAWRATCDTEDPWRQDEAPALTDLRNFSLHMVGIDILHTWHLGLARDVVASVLVLLLRRPAFFAARTIKDRIAEASKLAKDYARDVAHRALPRQWCFTRARLNLKTGSYVEFHGKGWQAGILLKWLESLFRERGAPTDDLYAVVALGNNFMPLLMVAREQGPFLTNEQAHQVMVLGQKWLEVYLRLHVKCKLLESCPYRLFNPRPKMHMMQHLLESCKGRRNPAIAMTFMDEDWLKRILRVTKKTHRATAAENTLLRWTAGLQETLQAALPGRSASSN